MTLVKTSLLNGVAVLIKLVTLIGLNKILAVYIGPSGYAALGQFQNSIQMITSLASGAIGTGVTKYTAQYQQDTTSQHAIWRTAAIISLTGSFFVAIIIILLNQKLANWVLKNEDFGSVFVWFAVTLVFFVLNGLLLAIINGKKEVRLYVVSNIAGSLVAFGITVSLAVGFGVYGALVALAVYQSLTFIVTSFLIWKTNWFKFSLLWGAFDRESAKKLSKFASMAVASAVCVPISHILVRNHLGEAIGWEEAGYWEAMWRLSGAYLVFVTATLSLYYLPRFSEIEKKSEVIQEIFDGYKVILPISMVFGFLIYYFRDYIIRLLFTVDFADMAVLFGWQMIGDTLKVAGWVLAYLILGKAMTKVYIFSEIFFALSFYSLTVFFTSFLGLKGAAVAHATNYLLYFIAMAMTVSAFFGSGMQKIER